MDLEATAKEIRDTGLEKGLDYTKIQAMCQQLGKDIRAEILSCDLPVEVYAEFLAPGIRRIVYDSIRREEG